MLYRLVLSELFKCRLDSEACAFLPQYVRMVRWWLGREKEVGQVFRLYRNMHYVEWKRAWKGYQSQHAQSSSVIAYSALKAKERNGCEVGVLGDGFASLSSRIVRVEGEKLVFPTVLSRRACVQLIIERGVQRVLLEQAQNRHWLVGQVYLTSNYCVIPFTRFVDLSGELDPFVKDLVR